MMANVKLKIKKDDLVVVIAGKYKGKKGRVLEAMPKENKVIVEGVNEVKRHKKATQVGEKSGIITKNLPINVSNVALVDPKTNKPTRVGYKKVGDKKVRFAKKSGEQIDK
jgi:large subunit ribosomal protein L24